MANLKALREKAKNITDYSPELQAYNDQLDELINDAYYSIWTAKRWSFATKSYEFKFYPDILPDRDVVPPNVLNTASVNKGSRQVVFAALIDRLDGDWEGQPIEIQDYEYKISKVIDPQTILLDEVFHGTTSNSDSSWAIKRRYYDLPQDCIELLSLGHKDTPITSAAALPSYGKVLALMPRTEEQLGLRRDYKASYAESYIWSPSQSIPSGEKLDVTIASTATGGFTDGTYLEVCWAFLKDGKLGPLSEPLSFQITGVEQGRTGTIQINFLSWDDQVIQADSYQSKDREPTQYEGLRKVVFWNANYNRSTGERLGLPVWKEFNQGGATRNNTDYLSRVVADDVDASVTITNVNQIDSGNDRYIEYDGQHLRIRPYPRVDAWDMSVGQQAADANYSQVNQDFLRYGIARYFYKPEALGMQTDGPQMPAEFHQLIVYKLLETLHDKLGNMSQADNYRRRIEKEIKRLEKRYVNHVDSLVRRGQFGVGGSRFYYDSNSLKHLG